MKMKKMDEVGGLSPKFYYVDSSLVLENVDYHFSKILLALPEQSDTPSQVIFPGRTVPRAAAAAAFKILIYTNVGSCCLILDAECAHTRSNLSHFNEYSQICHCTVRTVFSSKISDISKMSKYASFTY